jgi:hypothetical protein
MRVQKVKVKRAGSSSTKRLHGDERLLVVELMKGVAGSLSRMAEAQWTELQRFS